MGNAAPVVHEIGVDAVRQRHAGHRGTGPRAIGQDLLLELSAVGPMGLGLRIGHSVLLSRLVDTIVAAYAVALKGGITGRLQSMGDSENHQNAHIHCLLCGASEWRSFRPIPDITQLGQCVAWRHYLGDLRYAHRISP